MTPDELFYEWLKDTHQVGYTGIEKGMVISAIEWSHRRAAAIARAAEDRGYERRGIAEAIEKAIGPK